MYSRKPPVRSGLCVQGLRDASTNAQIRLGHSSLVLISPPNTFLRKIRSLLLHHGNLIVPDRWRTLAQLAALVFYTLNSASCIQNDRIFVALQINKQTNKQKRGCERRESFPLPIIRNVWSNQTRNISVVPSLWTAWHPPPPQPFNRNTHSTCRKKITRWESTEQNSNRPIFDQAGWSRHPAAPGPGRPPPTLYLRKVSTSPFPPLNTSFLC